MKLGSEGEDRKEIKNKVQIRKLRNFSGAEITKSSFLFQRLAVLRNEC